MRDKIDLKHHFTRARRSALRLPAVSVTAPEGDI